MKERVGHTGTFQSMEIVTTRGKTESQWEFAV